MRTTSDVRFAHPVLGVGTNMKSTLTEKDRTVIINSIDEDNYSFEVSVNLENDAILSYIESGYAEFCFEMNCSRTFQKAFIRSKDPKATFTIRKDHLSKSVDFNCFVTVSKPIEDYTNPDFKRTYPAKINLEIGEVLAIYPTVSVPLGLKLSDLRYPTSLMRIESSTSYDTVMYSLDGDKITIFMPEDMYKIYHPLPVEKKAFSIQPLAISAITIALSGLQKGLDEQRDWAIALKTKIKTDLQEEYDLEYVIETANQGDASAFIELQKIAQLLLGNPFDSLFNSVNTLEL